jgi:hypothetical protein
MMHFSSIVTPAQAGAHASERRMLHGMDLTKASLYASLRVRLRGNDSKWSAA